jgi:hypothetical protein
MIDTIFRNALLLTPFERVFIAVSPLVGATILIAIVPALFCAFFDLMVKISK